MGPYAGPWLTLEERIASGQLFLVFSLCLDDMASEFPCKCTVLREAVSTVTRTAIASSVGGHQSIDLTCFPLGGKNFGPHKSGRGQISASRFDVLVTQPWHVASR